RPRADTTRPRHGARRYRYCPTALSGTITELAEAYVDEFAALDPVRAARSMGVALGTTALTDYSPDGVAALGDLARRTAAALRAAEPADEAERLGRLYLLE